MSEYRDLTDTLASSRKFKREADEIGARLATQIAEAQAEADARLELEAERVERAREWERAKEKVRVALAEVKRGYPVVFPALDHLITALDELERLEERGV